MRNKLVDLRARLKRMDDGSPNCYPWGNCGEDRNLDLDANNWAHAEERLKKLLGRHRIDQTLGLGQPEFPTLGAP